MTLKNGDIPAMPITSEQAQDADMWGMSKREMMAMHIAAGLISAPQVKTHQVAEDAVRVADLLLAELERVKTATKQQYLEVPEGWQFAPKVPTREMIEQGNAAMAYDCCSGDASDAYQAMLAAAPKLGGE